MKKLEKLSLHNLAQNEMSKKEQSTLVGGGKSCDCSCPTASCPCLYAGSQEGPDDSYYGGSSIAVNEYYNTLPAGTSIGTVNYYK